MIEEAKDFIFNKVTDPALDNPNLDKTFKNKIQNSKNVINQFKKTGDLFKYLKRYEQKPTLGSDKLYDGMKLLGLETFEDVISLFKSKFNKSLDDMTILDDFIIGEVYTSWDIAIFSEAYNVQTGIYRIPGDQGLQAIFIKATLEGGKYPNKWLVEEEELKYYLYSLKEKFDPNYKVNKAIINSSINNVPIYVFIKDGLQLTLSGVFKYIDIFNEQDGAKWFKLKKITSSETDNPMTEEEYQNEMTRNTKKAARDKFSDRQRKIKQFKKHPNTIRVIRREYKRNPYVVAEVLERANGYCENCGSYAPFDRASDGTPYLEVHHIIPLSEGGADTVKNASGICPNCHRKAHFG